MKIEKILTEDIEGMKKFYPNIPDNQFQELIEYDPTYVKGSANAGTYGKWILGLANKGPIENIGHLTDVLKRFEKEKNHLVSKDIFKYKSIQELENMLNNDDSYVELSHRQEVRKNQDARRNVDLGQEADLVYEDSDWEVWVPKTYAASCKLGQGTHWCTASTENDGYYKNYTEDGPLYININKHNPEEKYQFHFESDQFMDKDDNLIDLVDFLSQYLSLYNYYNSLNNEKPSDWLSVDDINEYAKTGMLIENNILLKVSSKLSEAIIPEGVMGIYENAFENCYNNLTSITIPGSVEILEEGLFYNCLKLKSVFLSNGVSIIEESAFEDCGRLTSIIIPNSVTSIGWGAFRGCCELRSIIIPNSVTEIENYTFSGCKNLANIVIPNSVVRIGEYAFNECESLTNIIIPDGVTLIENYTFDGCWNLTNVTIPESVTEIGESAFAECRNLKNVIIPNSVTEIGRHAFFWCASLNSIDIPDSVIEIDFGAFCDCRNLTNVSISSGVDYIGNEAFELCATNLTIRTDNEYVINYCKENNIRYELTTKKESLSITEALQKLKYFN